MRKLTIGVGVLLLSGVVLAQTSTNFKLEEYMFNAGGTPSQGQELTSPSFSITLASIGDTVAASGLNSNSFQMNIGFVSVYPPPVACYFVDTVCDGVINILDVQRVLNAFGTSVGDPGYNPVLDIVSDDTINILDAQNVLNHFGETAPFPARVPLTRHSTNKGGQGLARRICPERPRIAATTTTHAATPTTNDTFYYLVTVENKLAEEGTKGFQSNMTERLGAVCP